MENAGLGGAVRICSEGTFFLHLNQVVLHWLKWLEGDQDMKDDVASTSPDLWGGRKR